MDLVVLASDIKHSPGTLAMERMQGLAYQGVEDGQGNTTDGLGLRPPLLALLGHGHWPRLWHHYT